MAGLGQSPSFPKAEQQAPNWQTATELLMLVVEHGRDPTMARIAMTRAFWRREPDATLRQAPKSHTRSFNSMGMSALLRTTDSTRTSRHVRDVPKHKVAALQPAAREQEPRGR
jgi:hypothetical protein